MGCLYFISILGWALLLMLLLPKLRIGHALLCSVCAMLFFSFYLVIALEIMAPAAYLLIYGGLCAFLIGAAAICANWRNLRARMSLLPLAAYLLGSLACVLLTRNAVVSYHDDMSYWMRIVKELYLYERFPIHANSTMYHSDYIPLLASHQYCLMRAFGWKDAYALYVTFTIMLTGITALMESVKKRSSQLLLFPLLLLAAPCVSFSYFSVRSDLFMGFLFGAGVICFFTRENDDFVSLLPSFCAAAVLTGFKIYSGLMFAVVLAASMIISALAKKKNEKKRVILTVGILSLLFAVMLHFTWSALYNYHTIMASYEAAALRAEYTGAEFMVSPPDITLSLLIKGNPRNQDFATALSQDSLQAVGLLIKDTFARYFQSTLPLVLVVLILCFVLAFLAGEHKKRYAAMLATVLAGYIIYALGLFATYFVQAETAPASNTYLATSSLPILMAAAWMISTMLFRKDGFVIGKRVFAAGVLVLMMILCTPERLANTIHIETEPVAEAAMAEEFYTDIISDQLYETDVDKRALVIDCSYEAAEFSGKSGKTHAYQFYALPMRTTVKIWPVEDYSNIDQASRDYLISVIEENRCELLILRIDDEVYWYTLMEELVLEGENDSSIGVYDIIRDEDGNYSFVGRMNE
ncbi:MAG: hypothetical protein J6K73_12680 [Clostridia bacterium]|nr:hypothetical protein [Clostridia bacterium]